MAGGQTTSCRGLPFCGGDSRGVAFIEFALVLPLVVFLFLSIIDTGQMINQYLSLTHISYEGARYGSTLAGLPPVPGATNDTSQAKRDMIQERVITLLELSSMNHSEAAVQVLYVGADAVAGTTQNTVEVAVTVPYHAVFQIYDGLQITARATAPYLFKMPDK